MPKQLLLVDDSVTIHRVVQITFAREDYTVTSVKSADDGIAKAKELKPDAVLADAGMSGKNGYDVCAALRADGNNTPVLILTGNFNPYDEARGSKAGADGFVVKPFETQALIDKVNDLVARKSGGKPAAPPQAATMMMEAPKLPPEPPKPAAPPPEPPKPAAPVAAPQPAHPAAPPPPPVRGWTMAMPTIQPSAPLVPPAPPKPAAPLVEPPRPVEPPRQAAKDESVEITIEPDVPAKPAPLVPPAPPKPAAPVAAPKPAAPAPPLVKPVSPAAAPQASTMMMEAPKLPTAPAPSTPAITPPVISPKEAPQASTMMMEAPKLPTAPAPSTPAPPPVVAKPSPTGQVKVQATITHDAPKMPRASLIPHVAAPQPQAATPAPAPAAAPSKPAPRSTIMGMPAINPNALGGPTGQKPAVSQWSPPPTAPGIKLDQMMAKAEQFKKEQAAAEAAAAAQPPAAAPAPKQDLSPLVAAVAEKAHAEVAVRSADVQIMTREVVEKIAWEVVPELAEVMLKEHVEKLASGKK